MTTGLELDVAGLRSAARSAADAAEALRALGSRIAAVRLRADACGMLGDRVGGAVAVAQDELVAGLRRRADELAELDWTARAAADAVLAADHGVRRALDAMLGSRDG